MWGFTNENSNGSRITVVAFEILDYLMNLWSNFPFFHVPLLIKLQDLVFTDLRARTYVLLQTSSVSVWVSGMCKMAVLHLLFVISDGCERGEQRQAVLC